MKLTNWIARLRRRPVLVLSLAVAGARTRWVLGTVLLGRVIRFQTIVASGGLKQPRLLQAEGPWGRQWVDDALADVQAQTRRFGRPTGVVFAVPSRNAFLGELVVDQADDVLGVRYQIDEMMQAAAGETDREAAVDWQLKASSSDGADVLAVAAIDQEQVDDLLDAAAQAKLECLGITLDHVAAINGYLQMLPAALREQQTRFLLHGELNRQRVRLAVFSQGVLFHETMETSEDGFSVVQAVAALEKLVSAWVREGASDEAGEVRLVLGGELMTAKGSEATASRSQVLAPKLMDVPARRELAANWQADVVAFGALEALPCA